MSEIVSGIAMWAFVGKPNTRFDEEGKWQVDVIVDKNTASMLKKKGLRILEKDGNLIFRPQRRVVQFNGEIATKPLVFDVTGKELTCAIGNGSEIEVQFRIFPFKRVPGNGADLEAVKVNTLVEYAGDPTEEREVMFKFDNAADVPF